MIHFLGVARKVVPTRTRIEQAIAGLYPGYFALVMATGIISTDLAMHHQASLSQDFLGMATVFYGGLWVLYVWRIIKYPDRVQRDLGLSQTQFGYFTMVAASGVLGSRLYAAHRVGFALGLAAIMMGLWVVLTYWTFLRVFVVNRDPHMASLNGGWLLSTVATESVATLGILLVSPGPSDGWGPLLMFGFWASGVVLYFMTIFLIMFRFIFTPLSPRDLQSNYWINMGAVAIATLTGARLMAASPHFPFLADVRPFVEGMTVLMWAWGSWWIPLLIGLGIWKYVIRRYPWRYEPVRWSMVFPLGMYSAASGSLAAFSGLHPLWEISQVFLYLAMAGWLVVAVSFGQSLIGKNSDVSAMAQK